MSTHPDAVLQELKQGVATRTERNLDKLHEVCRALHQAGGRDYSLAAVGRRSEEHGGPAVGTLYTTAGKPFRALIAAWGKHAGIDSGKAKEPHSENDWLRRIPDPADRALIGMMIAERKPAASRGELAEIEGGHRRRSASCRCERSARGPRRDRNLVAGYQLGADRSQKHYPKSGSTNTD